MSEIMETVRSFGPVVLVVWSVTVACTLIWPQRYFNSLMLMFSLLVTMLFVSAFFGDNAGVFLLICFLAVAVALFIAPVLLIINGVQMIRKESLCLAHVLSLALGIVVAVGEIATVIYVLGLADFIQIAEASIWILALALTVFYFSSLILSFVVYSVFIQILPHRMNYDYVIIHGCGLAGGERVTKLLSNRIDKAVEIYRRCKAKPIIIPSGGRGEDEKISEALAMKNYLLEQGIPEEHIVLEDRSATTRENLIFSKEIIEKREGRKRTALVSSNYHIYRCLKLARSVGLRCTGIGAKVAAYFWPSALIREFIAVFFTKGFLLWALAGYVPILLCLLLFYNI